MSQNIEKLEITKNLVTLATPLAKAVVDSWLAPKIAAMKSQFDRTKAITDHFFDNKFEDYLIERYKSYSVVNILAFRNQQRLLSEIYHPLTLKIEPSFSQSTEYCVTDYDNDFVGMYKRLLIVDTAGMGKSTISKKLFLSSIENNSGIPVFIELRRLKAKRTILDEIFEELKLINENIDENLILDLIRKGDFIFFFDGYDEVSTEDKKNVTEDIQRFINNSAENTFILTSRPDDSLTSFGNFQSFSINSLKESEVYQLLSKYDDCGELSTSLISKLKNGYYHDLREFLKNPLLVTLLYTAYEYKHIIPLKKHIFYRQVYDALFEAHDLSKGDYYQREKFSKLGIDDFHTILRYVAFICLKNDKIEFNKDEILLIIQEAKEQCEIINFRKSDFLKDLITTVPLFVKEGLYYKWAHKSLYEYFVAHFIYQDTGDNRSTMLQDIAKTQYINILDIYANIDYKSFRNSVSKKCISNFVKYCEQGFENPELNKESVIFRKELVYDLDLLVIQAEPKDKTKDLTNENFDSYSELFFKISQETYPEIENGEEIDGYGVRVSNEISQDISKMNHTVVMDCNNYGRSINEFIISLSFTKNELFVKKIKWVEIADFRKVNLPKRIPLFVSEDLKSPLNQSETIDFVNNLITAYYVDDEIFDYVESKKFLEKQMELESQKKPVNFFSLVPGKRT